MAKPIPASPSRQRCSRWLAYRPSPLQLSTATFKKTPETSAGRSRQRFRCIPNQLHCPPRRPRHRTRGMINPQGIRYSRRLAKGKGRSTPKTRSNADMNCTPELPLVSPARSGFGIGAALGCLAGGVAGAMATGGKRPKMPRASTSLTAAVCPSFSAPIRSL